jgi:hypothetical protein
MAQSGGAQFSQAEAFDTIVECAPDGFRAVAGEYESNFDYCASCGVAVSQA